jgi:Tol biopolymer transport system component
MRYVRELGTGQSCRILIADTDDGSTEVIFESDTVLFEAPNWSRDGLILNGDGLLWRLAPERGAVPQQIPIQGVPDLNNDHVLAPDGATVFVSANDWHIYEARLDGGDARRITPDNGSRMHFLHGVSPDGSSLAYIAVERDRAGSLGPGSVHAISTDGSGDRRLTFGSAPADGSEYSPDGQWIYFNTETFSVIPGHAQIARMRPDGGELEQLTFDERVNWFPHLSPDGRCIVYLSYPPGTIGHPPDLQVELRLVRDGDWGAVTVLAELFGGQGTINVNSWSPDGRRFGYVDYPMD